MGEWRQSTWGDEVSLEYGKGIRGYDEAGGRYRVYGSNGPVGWTTEAIAPGPGVILGRKGAYRGVRYSPDPFFVIDTAYYVRPKTDLDMRWLYYAIVYHKLGEIDDGSPIPSTTRAAVYVRDLDVPPLEEQRAIASLLGCLDDKIELVRRMNETLESLARAIFKDWFVDFGPTRAKAEGRPAYLASELWSLFPDRLDTDGKPDGWKIGNIEEVGDVICGKTPSTSVSEYYGNDVPFITIPDMHGKTFVTTTGKTLSSVGAASQPKKTLPANAICVSCIATPGLVVLTTGPSQTNQQINSVVPHDYTETYFWFWSLRNLGEAIKQGGSGGSVLSNLSTGRFSALRVLFADKALRQKFHLAVESLFDRILANENESNLLAQTRDLLLPKLMSGEIHLRDAEKIMEKVA
jgi:type I restriction enzyme, S subunit